MYIYQRSVGAYKGTIGGLQLLNINNAKLSSVIEKTRVFFPTVYDTITLEEYIVDMTAYHNEVVSWQGTIQSWLDHRADLPLIRHQGHVSHERYYVTMEDFQMAGYGIYPARHDWSLGNQKRLTTSGAIDLRLTHLFKDNVDYRRFLEHTLFTYNGYFVRAMARDDGFYLLGAGKNFNVNDHGHAGGISFDKISKVETFPMTPETIEVKPELDQVWIKIDKAYVNHTVWLVVGGKLIPNYPAISKSGEGLIKLDLRMLDLGNLLIKLSKNLDLNNLANGTSGIVKADQIHKESVIQQLMLDVNSFVVVLTNPHIGIEVVPLEQYTFPMTFATTDPHHHPVMLSDGTFPTYREREGAGHRRLLDFDVQLLDNLVNYETGPNNGGDLFHDKVNWSNPHSLIEAYSFKIYSVLKGM